MMMQSSNYTYVLPMTLKNANFDLEVKGQGLEFELYIISSQ